MTASSEGPWWNRLIGYVIRAGMVVAAFTIIVAGVDNQIRAGFARADVTAIIGCFAFIAIALGLTMLASNDPRPLPGVVLLMLGTVAGTYLLLGGWGFLAP
jgi:hypothetical protein